jgi:hypothetical protein
MDQLGGRMQRFVVGKMALAIASLGIGLGAAPAAPTYHSIARTIDGVQKAWNERKDNPDPNAPGWNAFFDALKREFRAYALADNDNDRLVALGQIYQMDVALYGVSWQPAADLREELRVWLRPRVQLAWAERRLVDTVQGLATTTDPAVSSNRQRWVQFVDSDLGSALREYEAAATVAKRRASLKKVYAALQSLDSKNKATPWVPSIELERAIDDLYNRPNLDVTADLATLEPVFDQNLVTNEPIYRHGYVTSVTPGPKTGFGLLSDDAGISFFNSQLMTTYTPITDFNQQVSSNPQGKRVAKLYGFTASTQDCSEVTVTATISPSGLRLSQSYKHNVDAAICSYKEPGGGFGRAIAALIGMNQPKITQRVYDGAIGDFRSNVEKEALELGHERSMQSQAEQNARLSQYLVGNDTLQIRNLEITGLSLRSRPSHALAGGKLQWKGVASQAGADAPEPVALEVPDPGVTADVHLSSILTSLLAGYFQSETVRSLDNLMIVTKKIPPGTPPNEGMFLTRNADFKSFAEAVETARAANDPKVLAIRVKRPGTAPEFAADARGFLVALVHDFQIEVPAPPQAAKGGLAGPPANLYRITAPEAEFVISFTVTPETQDHPVRLSGRVEGFDPGPGAKVFAIGDEESKITQLTTFTSALVLSFMRTKIQGQPIDVPLSKLKMQGFAIQSVSPLDPSGWIRANLVRTSPSPIAGVQ